MLDRLIVECLGSRLVVRGGRLSRLACAVALLSLPLACSNTGVPEFQAYQAAYIRADSTGQAVLDRLAVAERQVFELSQAPLAVNTVGFSPTHARYFVQTVDPPATHLLRRSLGIVANYNAALGGLASGETAEAMAARLVQIGNTAISLGAQFAGPVTGGASGLAVDATPLSAPLNALKPLAKEALELKTLAEFRERLLQDAGTMDDVLAGLIEITGNVPKRPESGGAPSDPRQSDAGIGEPLPCKGIETTASIFCVMIEPVIDRADDITFEKLTEEEVARIENIRVLLASWVVLLEESRLALAAAVEAVRAGGQAGSATLLTTLTDLDLIVREVRTTLATGAN
mgnify:CR=1 FL=1